MADERPERRAAERQSDGRQAGGWPQSGSQASSRAGSPASPAKMPTSNCPGNPYGCEFAQSLISGAIGAWQEESHVAQLRAQLSECSPCLLALDAEIGLRRTLQAKSQERAPQNVRIHISRTLGRISLDGITEADL